MDPGDLYGLPLERFVPERTALVKALRQDGERDQAARVAKLPKPSRAAWAVNQLVRTQKRAVAALFEAGDALQAAQADVIAGRGDAHALREAADRERAAVKRLTDAARGLLSDDGHALTAATVDRVSETLHAAALDEDARHQVEPGCLDKELRHVGLGGVGALGIPGAPPKSRPAERSIPPQAGRATREQAAAKQAEQAARKRAEQLKAARQTEADARKTAERAAKAVESAEQRRNRAAEALDAADAELAEARREAEKAARAHERAREELDRVRGN